MVIDRFLPSYQVRERHEIEAAASADRAYRAIHEVEFTKSAMTRFLFAVRGLPWRGPLGLRDIDDIGFVLLGEEAGTEIVYGLIGRFWRPSGGLRLVTPDGFVSFTEPGYAKAAWNFRVDPVSDSRSLVSTETRVVTTDDDSRRSFARYWRVIGPFSALIRRRLLALIGDEAERG
jgi:hypothetical protein